MAATRIGIDTGGTFTDVVRWSRRGLTVHKLPSTPDDPGRAVLAGLAAVRRTPGEEVDVVHGTTVGLNAVLTGRIARTAFVTNAGFEDLVEIGRQDREDIYALEPSRPMPPVPRELRVGVRCRREPDGSVETALSEREIARCVARLRSKRPQAVAVGLLHSPTEPDDEQRIARAVRAAMPGVPVTCSAELLPVFGEYERFCAAILNAAIAPTVSTYAGRLAAAVGPGRLRMLRSSLGIMPADEAAAFPTRAMFSGPAGGVLATAQVAKKAGFERAAAFDMGGTSADVCLVQRDGAGAGGDGAALAGLPLPVPAVSIHTVGCGGGSIAYVDAGGALRVGPQSAGADPGPACYGKSDLPTVTDAHVALGHLGADTLLDGGFPIDVDAAVRAVERLGTQLGMSAAAAARGVLEVADMAMARAILVITAERAVDPAQVPLVPYGGAGGLHAAGLIRRLGMPCALVPACPGAFSALGLALAGESVERSVAVRLGTGARDRRRLDAIAADLGDRARRALPASRRVRLSAVVRYRGQGDGLRLPLGAGLERRFAREHDRRFGFVAEAELEVVQVAARAETPPRAYVAPSAGSRPPVMADGHRRPPVGGRPLATVARAGLAPGARLKGPAVVEESTATTFVPSGYLAMVTELGILLRLADRSSPPARG